MSLAAAGAFLTTASFLAGPAYASRASSGPVTTGGDRLSIIVPAHAKASLRKAHPFSITIHGYVALRERLVAFVDYDACLSTPAMERERQARSVSYSVAGTFSRRSEWESALRRTDHVCAFLTDPATGDVLTRATASFVIH